MEKFQSYEETYRWLLEHLPMYQRIGPPAYKEGLDRIKALCQFLEQPQDRMGFVIHVAGTNGKGSVCHAIASVLQACGYKTGLFTSPHLRDFRERIRINGQCIGPTEVMAGVDRMRQAPGSLEASFFEFTTALAFEHFASHRVDFAVIETGLGGRLDSTNVVKPGLTAITHIDWDHMNLLGNALPLIAAEKAGIIKKGVPVVIGRTQEEDVNRVFEKKAHELRCLLTYADRVYRLESTGESLAMGLAEWKVLRLGRAQEQPLQTDLLGHTQGENLAQVLTMVEVLRNAGVELEEPKVREGLLSVVRNTGMQGRWQVLGQNPLRIVDVAHNPEGIQHALEQAATYRKPESWSVVLGVSADKDIDPILHRMPRSARYYFAAPDNPRSLPAEVLAQKANAVGLVGLAYKSVEEAWNQAVNESNPHGLVLALGSFFVVAEIPLVDSTSHG